MSPPDRIVILDGHTLCPGPPDPLNWAPLANLVPTGSLVIHPRTPAEKVLERATGFPFVLTNKTPLDADALAALPGLRYVGILATGTNVVDLAAAVERGVTVTNIPAYGADSVAQHAFALLFELLHQTCAHAAAARDGRWSRHSDWCLMLSPSVELAGKVMGIVGLGSIGKRVATIAAALGMTVLAAHQPSMRRVLHPGVELQWAELDDVFARADVVSLHCPLTPDTAHLVNAKRLGRMKPSAFLINTARGGLIDERALAGALTGGAIAGAGLDVLSVEPPPIDHPLLRCPRCVVTPHVAWASVEARRRLIQIAANNVRAFQLNSPQNVVTPA